MTASSFQDGAARAARRWLLSAALFSPVAAVYAVHLWLGPPGVAGTGFIQYDQPGYMADARAYFADGYFSLTYGLPFSPDPGTPRIYFQPLTLLLGIVQYLSRIDPGYLYAAAGAVLGISCCRVIVALYEEVVGLAGSARRIGLICFVWGGGFVTIAGLVYAVVSGAPPSLHLRDFDDDFGGWWCLNLGRNLIYPMESFYHAVFLGAVLFILRGRFVGAALCAAVLSMSHPFTGLQLIAVLGAWAVIETSIRSVDRPPPWFIGAIGVIGLLHLGYYLVFLSWASPEHRDLQAQWALPWLYHYWNFLVSHGLVAILAGLAVVASLRRGAGLARGQRLFLIWFGVALVLANHDVVARPMQPLHFTHGYIWTPLFLLGVPVLVTTLDAALRNRNVRVMTVAAVLLFFLADNAAWLGEVIVYDTRENYLALDASERQVLSLLGTAEFRSSLLVSQDDDIGYLATVYGPVRSWYANRFNTPYAARRKAELDAFFGGRGEPPAWRERSVVLVIAKPPDDALHGRLLRDGFQDKMENPRFIVMTRDARARL